MQFDFFEEFPSEETLAPARLWNRPCVVYLAAQSLEEYDRYADMLRGIQPLASPAFWPILPGSYWVSPFSSHADLNALGEMLRSRRDLDVLLDLELPVLAGKRRLFLRGLPGFFKGRRIIREILQMDHRFLLAVYPAAGPISAWLLHALGIDSRAHESCVMFYTSMIPAWLLRHTIRALGSRAKRGQTTAGFGCLAAGIFGTEGILSPEALAQDLAFARSIGLGRIIFFRLAGLDKKFVAVLERALAAQGTEVQ